jgi:outer membrane protein
MFAGEMLGDGNWIPDGDLIDWGEQTSKAENIPQFACGGLWRADSAGKTCGQGEGLGFSPSEKSQSMDGTTMARRILKDVGASILVFGVVGCMAEPPGTFDPRMLQQMERAQADQVRPPQLSPLPTTRQDPNVSDYETRAHMDPTARSAYDAMPVVRMSLREIVHRAVANNHDVKVAGYQPAIEGTRVEEAKGHFDPVYFANTEYDYKDELTGGQVFNDFSGGLFPITSNLDIESVGTVQTGFQQNLESGGQVQLQYTSTYSWFDPQRTVENPFYTSQLTLQLTQPILKNYGYDINQAQITISRLTQKESILEFRKAVESNVSDIEKAYWQLVQAEHDIRIQQELVAETETTYQILNTRMIRGLDVSQLQVSQAETVLQTRRAQLIQFQSQARDLSDQIKALMSDPEYPVAGNVLILPADAPVEAPMVFDMEDEIDTAMDNRFELGEQQLKIDAATVTVTVARNNLLPELDFIGSVGPQGGGSNLPTAIRTNADFDHTDYTLGFKFTMDIGYRAERAIWQRTLLQRDQAIEQYASLTEQVAVDVSTAARAVSTAWDEVGVNREGRYHAEAALRAINERERDNEPLTPVFVQLKLDTQERLAEALQAEAEAVANYNIALAALERAKGTLLRYNNVLLEEEQTGEQTPEAGQLH